MTRTATIQTIAKLHLGIQTLTRQKSDSLDFHDLAVWSVEAALEAAFEAGLNATKSCNGCKAGQA